ncbi:MAG: hypothetical protein EAZ92_14090 [Candidatus Kapaibacterium sp.]|nr:MAG: hypothetical protein EAZ92_14090 [Candidatus Kapabacteria bacterium]
MDTETLVKSKVQAVEAALFNDKHHIQLEIAPLEDGWQDVYVIHAKPLEEYDSCFAIIEEVTSKLYLLTDPAFRRHISHIQVYDVFNEPSCISSHIEKMFTQRELV